MATAAIIPPPSSSATITPMHLPQIRAALAGYRPALLPARGESASVAMILCDGEGDGGLQVVVIERARRDGDPWSGQLAFPGGRREAGDRDARHTAERETREEIAVDLAAAERLGRLDDQRGRTADKPLGLVIRCFVYHHPAPARPRLSGEVSAVHRVPLGYFVARRRQHFARPLPGLSRDFPAVHIGADPAAAAGPLVWGLTYRFLSAFFRLLGRPLPQ